MANLAAFFYQNIYWKSLKNPERILKSSDFGNDNTFCLLTDKKSLEFLLLVVKMKTLELFKNSRLHLLFCKFYSMYFIML